MTMRRAIRAEVASVQPFDALEEAHQRETLAWIDSGAALCRLAKPATPPQHLVAYFVLVDQEHVLLVDHIKAQLWLPPGGHVEPDEHPRHTVKREAMEELGIDAELVADQPVFLTVTQTVGLTAGHVDVSLWYLLRGDRHAALTLDAREHQEAAWFHAAAVPFERADPHLRRFLNKLAQLKP